MQFQKIIALLVNNYKFQIFLKMNFKKVVFLLLLILVTQFSTAQKSAIYTNALKEYNQALELYNTKAYVAAQQKFNKISEDLDNASELKANSAYYAANCAIRLGQRNSDELMQQFVNKYPTSTKRTSAFLDVAEYYFKAGKYAYAAKWYSKVNATNLSLRKEEAYNFKYAYSLFATKSYTKAKSYFLNLLDSPEYGAQAKYYYGFIAYNQDDFDTANKYLEEVADDNSYKKNVSYYLADMNFKLGKFEKAIEYGLPLLDNAKRMEHSEISKIIGESYFNLENYKEAIPHLKNYKGKRGKWNNTDYYLLGYAFYKQNNYEDAISYFNKIISGNNAVAQNAYYHLAECYLKLEKKQEALNAFKNAAEMKFKPEIKKDAWLNYAKLSYEIGNPYKAVPEILQEYVSLYPNSKNTSEIKNLIVSSYLTSNDYDGALEYLKNKKSSFERKTFQKVAFYRGIELFNEGNFDLAKENFEISLNVPLDSKITALATFWLGECNYKLNNFNGALVNYQQFLTITVASNTNEIDIINYNIAYTYFKLKEYPQAIAYFKKYLNQTSSEKLKSNDSFLRIADSYFVTSNYKNAIEYYNKAINNNVVNKDYAHFQKAISYGLTGNEQSKIKALASFLHTYTKSVYLDDAYYVLGNSYLKTNNSKQALMQFKNLINLFKRSKLVSKAMLKMGLIYYNNGQNNLALETYKNIVSKFPKTAEANEAVKNSRQIYVDIGKVDEYAQWVKSIDFINVSNTELDNDMYEAAEKQFLQNNNKKAISNFKKYLQNFTNGLHSLKANFYLAKALYAEKSYEEAIPYFNYAIQSEQNEFTENAFYHLSLIHLEANNWQKAIPVLQRLEQEANSEQNRTFAQSNLMKGYFSQKIFDKAVSYAELILANSKVENRIKSDANIIIARSAFETNNLEKARKAYKNVEKIATGNLKAEALFYSAYFENLDGSYRVSNEIIQQIAANYGSYKYWAAKGLLVMASNYNELNDAYQATYILESVITNFSDFDDVVATAKKELAKIKTEQAKTNESIKANNNK